MGTKAISGDDINTITNKKKIILGLAILGILAVFLAGCTEQQSTASAQTTTENIQFETPQEVPKNQGNFSPGDRQIPPQDGNFTPGVRPDFPKEWNFAPPDRK